MNTIGELRVLAQSFAATGDETTASLLVDAADGLEEAANTRHYLNEALLKEISDHKITKMLLQSARADLHYASGDHMGPST